MGRIFTNIMLGYEADVADSNSARFDDIGKLVRGKSSVKPFFDKLEILFASSLEVLQMYFELHDFG